MSKLSSWKAICIVCVLCAVAAIASPAQIFTTLVNFGGTEGANPAYEHLVQGTDGNLYGTTFIDGAYGYGTVFKMTPGGRLTTLYSFCAQAGCTDGENPGGLVQATDGSFYGTTDAGGVYNYGTLFKVTPGGTLTTLHSFDGTDGAYPRAG